MSRLGHFVKDMGGAVQNVAKGVNYVANPTHIDDIAKGAAQTGQFMLEHPGVVKDVGVSIVKDQLLDPKNLAINLALTAATVATSGTAGAALAARVGMSAKAAEGAVATVRGAKAVEAAAEAARGAKVAETAVEAGRAARATSKAVELGRAAQEVVEGGSTGSKWARGLEKVNDVRRTASPIAQRTHAFRTAMGERALSAGLEEGATAGPLRQVAANLIQGTGGIGATTRMAGQSESAYKMQQAVRYSKMARSGFAGAKAAPGVASAVADPEGYAMNKMLNGAKMGDTGEGQYQTAPGGRTIVTDNANGVNVTDNGVVQPSSAMEHGLLRAGAKMQNFGVGVAASNSLGGPNAFWKGPGREAFGGISTNYDWRKFEQRPVNQVTRSSAFTQGFTPLAQPAHPTAEPKGETPPAAAPAMANKPSSPPTLPPMKMAKSNMYAGGGGTESVTTPGVRVLPKANANERGGVSGRVGNFASGKVYGEDTSTTITGGKSWNDNMEGSMTFPEEPKLDLKKPLVQPKQLLGV